MVQLQKLLRTLLIACVFFASLTSAVPATAAAKDRGLFPGGGDHPWPWGHEVPFPWDEIQGIWRLDIKGTSFYYSFRRLHAKRMVVNQFDLDTCAVLASGPGLERANTVVAQMSHPSTRQTYRVTLYAFNPKDSPESPKAEGFEPGHVMVARIQPLSSKGPEIAAQIVKISARLDIRCGRANKFLKF